MQVPTCWTEGLPLPQSLQILEDLSLRHLSETGARGTELRRLILEHRWTDVVNYEITYDEDWDILQLVHMRQAHALFSKLENIPGFDKEESALQSFHDAERACHGMNLVLRTSDLGTRYLVPRFVRLMERARRKIRSVLGVCPKADRFNPVFGPGATTTIRKTMASPTAKLAGGFLCSTDLYASGMVPSILRSVPHWTACFESEWGIDDEGYLYSRVPVQLARGHLVFVPKNAKTYRSICIEPVLNSFFQQGIRKYMEARLGRYGLSTNDQSKNQRLARLGSLHGNLATIDLSSASDRISYQLVKSLLPADWFSTLAAARTGAINMPDGSTLILEKFSSMGNATTFPLETLLFWAIASAAMDVAGLKYDSSTFSVYGDDIIVPSEGYSHVTEALEYLGFKVNGLKSFASGPFRESCGADYYKGYAVRPFYQKELVSGETLFTLHNHYVRSGLDEFAAHVRGLIPAEMQIYGPDGYGDGHLITGAWCNKIHKRLLKKGYGGVCFDTYSRLPRSQTTRYPGDYVSPLYTVYVSARCDLHPLHPRMSLGLTEAPLAVEKSTDGRPRWVVPGSRGYKRISIYTLAA